MMIIFGYNLINYHQWFCVLVLGPVPDKLVVFHIISLLPGSMVLITLHWAKEGSAQPVVQREIFHWDSKSKVPDWNKPARVGMLGDVHWLTGLPLVMVTYENECLWGRWH